MLLPVFFFFLSAVVQVCHLYRDSHIIWEAIGSPGSGFLPGCLPKSWSQWEWRGQAAESDHSPFPFSDCLALPPPRNLWFDHQQTHTPIFCTLRYRFQKGCRGWGTLSTETKWLSAKQSKRKRLLHKKGSPFLHPSCHLRKDSLLTQTSFGVRGKPIKATGTQSWPALRTMCTPVQKWARSKPEVKVVLLW
jgi:hypothetical protein